MNEETQKLINKATRSLAAARRLFESGDYDFASSRAYYSMFYVAEAALLIKGLSFSSHSAVISGFYEHFVKTKIFPNDLHKKLHHAFILRQEGDYTSTSNISPGIAENLLNDAAYFIKEVSKQMQSVQK